MFNLFMKSNKKRAKKRAFTLVELIIVIVILGILMGVAALSFTNVTQSSKDGVAKANLRAVKSACQVYAVDNKGALPKNKGDLDNYLDPALKTEFNGTASGYTYTLTHKPAVTTGSSPTPETVELVVTGGGLDSGGYKLEVR